MKIKTICFLITWFIPLLVQAQYWGKYEHVAFIHAHDNDAGGSEIYWTITAGNSDKTFVVTPCSGQIKADTNIYSTFARSKTYYLTLRATDQGGLYVVQKLKIVLTKTTGRRNPPQCYVLP